MNYSLLQGALLAFNETKLSSIEPQYVTSGQFLNQNELQDISQKYFFDDRLVSLINPINNTCDTEISTILSALSEVMSQVYGAPVYLSNSFLYSAEEYKRIHAVEWVNYMVFSLDLDGLSLKNINPNYPTLQEFRSCVKNSDLKTLITNANGKIKVSKSELSLIKTPQFQCHYCGKMHADDRGKSFGLKRYLCHLSECETFASSVETHPYGCCYKEWSDLRRNFKTQLNRAGIDNKKILKCFNRFLENQYQRCLKLPPINHIGNRIFIEDEMNFPTSIDEIDNWDKVQNIDAVG